MKSPHLPHSLSNLSYTVYLKSGALILSSLLVFSQATTRISAQESSTPATIETTALPNNTTTSVPSATPVETELEITAAPATSLTLTASPPRVGDNGELTAKPGETLQTTLRIRNASDQTLNVASTVQDFIIGEDGSTPVAVTDQVSNRWSLASWVTLSTDSQILKPQQNGTVSVVISIPQDALPGGHYAMVVHEPSSNLSGTPDTSASRVAQRVGSLLYVIVDGPINESAFIRNFTAPQLSEFGPVPFTFTVENMSDIHIKPQFTLDIYNVFNQKVDTVPVESKNIFPYTPRNFEGEWNRIWGIGPYRAELTMSFGKSGSIAVAKTNFWLIPLKLVLAAVIVLLVLIALIIVIRRHLSHAQGSEKKRIAELERQVEQLSQRSSDQNSNTPSVPDEQ